MDYDLTDAYDYELPPELVAEAPAPTRTASRLMTGGSEPRRHMSFADLPSLLRRGDLLVFNDTRVVPARIHTQKPTGGAVELFVTEVLSPSGDDRWVTPADEIRLECMTRSSKRVRPGTTLTTTDGTVEFEVIDAGSGRAVVRSQTEKATALQLLERIGQIPLPPYIVRRRVEMGEAETRELDHSRYQTVYASAPGAVAAPTAGLHFDQALFERLEALGVETARLTLDVGPGTFKPVTSDRLSEHDMHTETYRVPAAVGEAIAQTRERGGRVIAVGTTSVRALESEALAEAPFSGMPRSTALFIAPGYDFKIVDAMITNFHLPRSTLLALVYAFAGPAEVRAMYEEAVRERYRFYSYGDAMFLTRST